MNSSINRSSWNNRSCNPGISGRKDVRSPYCHNDIFNIKKRLDHGFGNDGWLTECIKRTSTQNASSSGIYRTVGVVVNVELIVRDVQSLH